MSSIFEATALALGAKAPVSACAAVSGASLFVAGDDGSLRVYKNVAGAGRPPTFEAGETVPRFTKDRKPCRAMQVIPAWNALLSLTDSGAFLHPIDGLSRPGVLVPGSAGCTLVATSANGSLLALGSRTRVQVLAWNGDAAGGLAAATAPPARGGAAAAAAVIEALFTVLLDKPIGAGAAAAELAASSANRDRSAGSTGFLGFSSSKQPQAAGGATTVCVTRLTWVGGLLSVGVVHRSSTSLRDGDDEVHASDATGAGLDGSAGFVGSRADTEHCLTYLLIQPWTGQVMREVRAGPAPPLDVAGLLTVPAGITEPPGLAGAGSALLSLLAPGGASVFAGPPGAAKPVPSAWGAAVLIEALNEEEGLVAAAANPRAPPTDAATHTLDTPLGHALHAGRLAGAASAHPDGSASDALSAHLEEGLGRNVAGRLLVAAVRTGASGDSDAAGAACVGTCLTALGGSATGGPSFAFDAPPLDFYRCGSLPYVLTAMAGGVSVHNVHTGEQVQFLKVPGVLGMVVCPRAAEAARAMHRAAQAASLADAAALVGSDAGDEAGVGSSAGGQGEAAAAEAETVFVVARTGLLALRSLPLQMQLAALLSRRPPMLDTALALCEHARGIVAVASRSSGGEGDDIVAATGAETLVRREAGLRATLGYTLCSGGDYPSGMRLLLLAQEPVCNVLALFPQLAVVLDVAGGSVGGAPELELPSSAQAVTDEELPAALPSLIAYLERQRALCYATMDAEAAAAAAAASAATVASVSAFVGVTEAAFRADDAAPASTSAALAVAIDEALLAALLADARCAEEGPERDGGQGIAASRRARAVSLLTARNAVRCATGEALLAAYGRTASPLGCSELVALYHGKGMVERVVSVLAGSAEAAVHAGDAIGLPLSSATWSEAAELDGPMAPVVRHVRVLSAYLRRLGGRTHEGLVLATVARMLGGSAGRIGVLLGLSVLMPPTNWLGRGKVAPDAPFLPLNPVRTLAMLKSLDVDVDHVQFWGLRGDALLASGQEEGGSAAVLLSRLLASEGGESAPAASLWPSLAPPAPVPEGEAAGEEEGTAEGHAGTLSLDLRVLPPPASGWGRHFLIAYTEYLLAAFLSAPAAAGAPMPPGSVQELALAYVSVLREAAVQLDARPASRLEEETGLLREFRARLCGLLTLVRTKGLTLDAAAVLASIGTVPLHQECVLLLRLLGRDDEALGVLLWQLQDFAGADAYCASVWSERAGSGGGSGGGSLLAQEDTSSVYSALLRTYLTPVVGVGAGQEETAVAEAPAPPMFESPVAVLPALRGHSPRGAPVFTPVSEESEDGEEEESTAAASPAAAGDSASAYPHLSAMLLDRRLLPCPVETGVEGPAPHPVTVGRVMSILTRNPDRVRPVDALTLLPPALSLAAVLPFVEAASRHGSDALRTLVVARAFAGVTATRSQGALTARQSHGTTVEKISTCDTCGRRLAAGGRPAPFVYHPNGRVTHVTCTSAGPVKTGKEERGKGGRTVRGGVK